jgi:hypothetical protein
MYMTMERLKKEQMRDVTPKPAPAVPVQPATPEFARPEQSTPEVDLRPQATSPPTGAELNKAMFPDQFKF